MTRDMSPVSMIGLAVLAAVNVCLAATIGIHVLASGEGAIGATAWTPQLSLATPGIRETRATAEHSEILARPVFFKSRVPYVPPPPAPPPSIAVAAPIVNLDPGLVLAGVMITGRIKKAYFVQKMGAQGTWADEGENLMGWRVESIATEIVTLEQQGRRLELQLYPK